MELIGGVMDVGVSVIVIVSVRLVVSQQASTLSN
jgi:hypothetical protein